MSLHSEVEKLESFLNLRKDYDALKARVEELEAKIDAFLAPLLSDKHESN